MGCNNCFLSALQPTALTGFVSGLGCLWAGLRPISHSPSAEQSKAWEGWGYRPPKVPLAPESQCPPIRVAPSPCHSSTSLRTPGLHPQAPFPQQSTRPSSEPAAPWSPSHESSPHLQGGRQTGWRKLGSLLIFQTRQSPPNSDPPAYTPQG